MKDRKMTSTEPSPRMRIAAPGNSSGLRPPALVTVDVDDGDEIRWVWTYLADGSRVVTGCRVVPCMNPAELLHREPA